MKTYQLNNLTQANHLLEIAKRVYNVDPMNGKRERFNVFARAAISVQLLSTGEKYHYIGAFLKKDHTSIIHIVKNHPDRLQYDKEYKELYFKFLAEIGKPIHQEQLTLNEIKYQVSGLTDDLLKLNWSYDDVIKFWFQTINECKTQQS
jgi:hypothetical protein